MIMAYIQNIEYNISYFKLYHIPPLDTFDENDNMATSMEIFKTRNKIPFKTNANVSI